jgi:hypothetical protein
MRRVRALKLSRIEICNCNYQGLRFVTEGLRRRGGIEEERNRGGGMVLSKQ